jgi:hypothetical protein
MNAMLTHPPIESKAPAGAVPVILILVLALFGALIAAGGWWNLQAGAGAPGYSAPVLFNQANADAHGGKIGPAIVAYERARFLAPGDPNITANLQQVRDQAGLRAETADWLDRSVSWASPNTFALLGSLGLVLLGAGILSARSFARMRALSFLAAVAGAALLGLALLSAAASYEKSREVVVLDNDTPARIAPATNGEISSKLRAGETAAVHGRYQDFVLVEDSAGNSGWVARASVMPILP